MATVTERFGPPREGEDIRNRCDGCGKEGEQALIAGYELCDTCLRCEVCGKEAVTVVYDQLVCWGHSH